MAMRADGMHDDEALCKRLAGEIKQRLNKPTRNKFSSIALWASGIAAMITVVTTAALMTFRQPAVTTICVVATASSRTIVLSDSMVVYLNRNSTLQRLGYIIPIDYSYKDGHIIIFPKR